MGSPGTPAEKKRQGWFFFVSSLPWQEQKAPQGLPVISRQQAVCQKTLGVRLFLPSFSAGPPPPLSCFSGAARGGDKEGDPPAPRPRQSTEGQHFFLWWVRGNPRARGPPYPFFLLPTKKRGLLHPNQNHHPATETPFQPPLGKKPFSPAQFNLSSRFPPIRGGTPPVGEGLFPKVTA